MISIVIPTFTLNKDLEEMAISCSWSFRDHVDELIVTEDGGEYSDELRRVADIYIYNKENAGYTKNINKGWRLSTGDFTILGNSDLLFLEGDLKKICKKGKVICPKMSGYNVISLCGACFCVPREVQEKYGYLNEKYRMYGADSEYEKKILSIFETSPEADILHRGEQTTKVLNKI